jgi:flagellar hook-length control protein FliK
LNGAAATAATPAAASAPAPSAPPSADAGDVPDFLALLGGAPAGDAASNADPLAPADAAKAADDDGDPQAPDAARAELPELLLALRQSLALIVGGSAPTAPRDNGKPDGRANANRTAAPSSTANATSGDIADAALATATAVTDDNADTAADPAAPTVDRRFDAMLAAMTGHDASAAPATPAAAMLAPAANAAGVSSATASPPAAPPMIVPPDHPQFIGDLGERIVWIADAGASGGLTSAKIELHPLDLGSVSVHVQMRGDTAQVSFAADNPATRALLQDSLPQLRELMSVQGLQLLRAQVEQRVGATRASDTAFSQSRERGDGRDGIAVVRRVTRLKLLDAYA